MEYEDPKQITEAMKEGLARMYADQSMREYLVNATRIANAGAVSMLKANKVDEAKVYVTRLDVFKQLLEKGKENFVHFEKIRNAKKV